MANFFGSLGRGIGDLAEGAVQASPYVAQVVAQRKAKQDADRMKATQAQYAKNADDRASQALGLSVQKSNDQTALIKAQIAKMQQVPALKPEPMSVVVGADGKRTYVPRSQAAGKEAPAPEPRATPQEHFTPVTTYDDGGVPKVGAFNTNSGQIEGNLGGGKPSVPGGRASAAITKALSTNAETLSYIDRAIEAVKKHPTAFGLEHGRGLPVIGGMIDQRLDPEGVEARSLVANVGSQQIHDRTGAAMSVHEEKRLSPFVPGNSDTADKILTNLYQLKDGLTQNNSAMQHGGTPEPASSPPGRGRGGAQPNVPHPPNSGDRPGPPDIGASSSAPSREQQLWDAAVAKHGKEKVLQEYGPRP